MDWIFNNFWQFLLSLFAGSALMLVFQFTIKIIINKRINKQKVVKGHGSSPKNAENNFNDNSDSKTFVTKVGKNNKGDIQIGNLDDLKNNSPIVDEPINSADAVFLTEQVTKMFAKLKIHEGSFKDNYLKGELKLNHGEMLNAKSCYKMAFQQFRRIKLDDPEHQIILNTLLEKINELNKDCFNESFENIDSLLREFIELINA